MADFLLVGGLFYLFWLVLIIVWIVFPFVVFHRLRTIQFRMDEMVDLMQESNKIQEDTKRLFDMLYQIKMRK